MPRADKEELCAVSIFRRTWALLNKSNDIEEVRRRFKELVVELILGEG